ncbi:hypothetical protein [Undibacterium sp. Ji22W]|uniref:hypothetical protein n=1 Tax=Undibacterium sp. Ji22W TaxID=3413038 RepID=UPI003BEFEF2D
MNIDGKSLLSLWLRSALLIFCFASNPAIAEIIDHIDVVEREQNGDITIRFSQKIIYLRHASTNDQKSLRVFIKLIDVAQQERELAQEVTRSPRTTRMESVTVIYPELINAMLITFPRPTNAQVRSGADGRSIVITVPLLPKPDIDEKLETPAPDNKPVIDSAVLTSPPTMSSNEIDTRAKAFLDEANAALASKDLAKTINRLNRVLGLPMNASTEAAQAMIGEVRELNGENLKAKGEYELYIKLFPNGANITKIQSNLNKLPKENTNKPSQKSFPKDPGIAEWSYSSNLSSYYYTGQSQIETLTPPAPGQLTFNRDTLSMIDQNSLISSINFNMRRRDAFSDTRFVIRDTDNHNFLSAKRSYNRLYAAYIDHVDKKNGYYLRVGRQNPNGIGVLDRFDGLQTGLNVGNDYRLNAVYGNAVEFGSPFKKVFYGASADMQASVGVPGVSVYMVQQNLDAYQNRRALGSEIRYFDGKATAYAMLDYEVLYKGINIALAQGNYVSANGNNYFFVIDHRRAPGYSLTNALQAVPGLSMKEIIDTQGIKQVREQASSLTAMSDMFSIGVTRQYTEKWQVGVDYRLSSISSTKPVMAVLPLAVIGVCLGRIDSLNNTCVIDTSSQQASGKNHVVTFQLIGTNFLIDNAVAVSSLSLIKAPTYDGQAYSLAYAMPFTERAKIDTNLRYYTQKDNESNKQNRSTYSLKYSYQWGSNLYFEGEAGREVSNSTGFNRNDHSTRNYVFVGVRGDLR